MARFDPAREQAAKRLAHSIARLRRSFAGDAAACIQHVLPSVDGVPVQLAPIHRAWLAHVTWCWAHGYRAAIVAPEGHGKTTVLSIGLAAYLLGSRPPAHVRVYAADDGAAQHCAASVLATMRGANFGALFPGVSISTFKWHKPTKHAFWLVGYTQSSQNAVSSAAYRAAALSSDRVISDNAADYQIFDDVDASGEDLAEALVSYRAHLRGRSPDGRVLVVGSTRISGGLLSQVTADPTWVVLRQSVAADLSGIEQEVLNAPAGYPGAQP